MVGVDKPKISFSDSYFFKVLETINQAETLEQILGSMPALWPNMIATYHHFGAVGAFDYKDSCEFYAYNVPQNIVDYLDAHRTFKSNPAVVAVFSKGDAVWLSELLDHPYIQEMGHEKLTEATLELTGDALCLPLYGPNNRLGYMFLALGFGKADCDEFVRFRIELLAQKFHIRYCLMLQALNAQVKLTVREAEVLELISFGKTNSEIATVLGISSSTVGGYVSKIFLKLDVKDRVSAAMRAQTLKIKF